MDAAPAIAARAESLPLDDDAVDAAMACVTIHHWEPPEAGLAEMRRIARSRVVVFTFELDCLPAWQQDYLAEALAIERPQFQSLEAVANGVEQRIVDRLRDDLASGAWDAQHGSLRNLTSYDGAPRLVVA